MRRMLLGAMIAAIASAVLPASSGATGVILGQTLNPSPNSCSGFSSNDALQTATVSGVSYVVPFDGVLSSWGFDAPVGETTTLTMATFRPTGVIHHYVPLADAGPMQTVSAGSGTVNFPTRLTVQAGDIVGLHFITGACAFNSNAMGDQYDFIHPAAPSGTDTLFNHSTGWIFDVSARLETDADHDGFGDVTQDKCPTDASTQGPCPNPPNGPSGERAAALAKCRKWARKNHWSHKRLKKCKKTANLSPV